MAKSSKMKLEVKVFNYCESLICGAQVYMEVKVEIKIWCLSNSSGFIHIAKINVDVVALHIKTSHINT